MAAMESAVEVDVDDGSPPVGRQLGGRADEVASGVVDEDVERSESFDSRLHCGLDVVVVAHVGLA